MGKFSNGTKSQADQIAVLKRAGWEEETTTSLPWRWFDPKYPGIYYTLAHAMDVIVARKQGLPAVEIRVRREKRPTHGRTPE